MKRALCFSLLFLIALFGAHSDAQRFIITNLPIITTTFDPNQTDPRTTLSGGNLISTSNTSAAGGAYFVSRSVANNSSGQFYNEFTYNSIGTCSASCTYQVIIGVGNASAVASLGTDSNNSVGIFADDANFTLNSTKTAFSSPAYVVTNTVGMAVDLSAKLMWLRINGSADWNNTGGCTPANAGCGFSFAAITGPFFVYASTHDWSGIQITANFGATAYANTAPSGFVNWTNPGNGGGNAPYVFNPNATRAQQFVNALGVDTHITDISGPYNTVSNLTTDLTYLGINLIRDYGLDPYNANQANYATLAAAGNKFDMEMASQRVGGCSPNAPATITSLLTTYDTFVGTYPGSIVSTEGINELNNNPSCYIVPGTTNGSTAAGNATLHYAAVPAAIQKVGGYGGGFANNQITVSDYTLLNSVIDPGPGGPGAGHAHTSVNGTTLNDTITINHNSEKMLACIEANGGPIISITDTLGLSWAKRASGGASGATDEEEWTATGPSSGTPETDALTITQTSSAAMVADAFGVIGATGFDGSAVTGNADPLSITTSNANTVVIGCYRSASVPNPGAAPNWTVIAGFNGPSGNGNPDYAANLWGGNNQIVEVQMFSSTQSGLSVALDSVGPFSNAAGTANGAIADAIVLSAPQVLPIPTLTTLGAITSTTVAMAANAIGAGVASSDTTRFMAYYNQPGSGGPAPAIGWQTDIYNGTHGDTNLSGVPVINFTDFPSFGVTGTADYNNQHFYPGSQPGWNVGAANDIAGLPQAVTETGYVTLPGGGGASQKAQSLYILNDLLDLYTIISAKFIYIYELLDEAVDTSGFHNYGLFDFTNTPKTAATALQNMTTILHDSGGTALTFTTGTLVYSISPFPAQSIALNNFGAQATLMQKSNGHFFINVWNEPEVWNGSSDVTPPTVSATLTLPATETTVNVYDPQVQSTPINTYSSVSSVPLSIAADQLIVEVIP